MDSIQARIKWKKNIEMVLMYAYLNEWITPKVQAITEKKSESSRMELREMYGYVLLSDGQIPRQFNNGNFIKQILINFNFFRNPITIITCYQTDCR